MCDFDPPSFFNERIVIARKPHKCSECDREIPRGNHYERVTGKWDGFIDCYKTCLPCVKIRKALTKFGDREWGDACWQYGGLYEMISDVKNWNHEGTLLVAILKDSANG